MMRLLSCSGPGSRTPKTRWFMRCSLPFTPGPCDSRVPDLIFHWDQRAAWRSRRQRRSLHCHGFYQHTAPRTSPWRACHSPKIEIQGYHEGYTEHLPFWVSWTENLAARTSGKWTSRLPVPIGTNEATGFRCALAKIVYNYILYIYIYIYVHMYTCIIILSYHTYVCRYGMVWYGMVWYGMVMVW